ncbi:hypothetical protein PVMG_06165 [Plasmodium vivax Mauritania I]|uniref:Uncharacterized protein n=1 Tax=Plasmodium vivax Mauritania I TaxID=1035515 RepID=A0A0J9T334_PLAVI|nr:hypothetical protein PVMG_06165 [Plasmodium vivax Mauritania I]
MSYLSLLYSGEDDKTYSILKNLTLYDFYEKLDEELDKKIENSTEIENIYQHCQGQIASKAENGEKLIELCKKICNIILNVHGILNKCNDRTDNKACSYMEYWLYYKVMSLIKEQSLVPKFYTVVLMYTTFNKSNFKNCSLKNLNIDKNKFYIKKILYEFIEIYDEIKNKISHDNNLNVKLYCKHIKENFRYFNSIKEECTNQISCHYYDEYNQFKVKFSNPEDLKLICEKCNYEKTSCEKGSNEENDVPCLREKGNSILYLIFGNDTEDIIKVLLNVTIISAPILALFVILFKVIIFFFKI